MPGETSLEKHKYKINLVHCVGIFENITTTITTKFLEHQRGELGGGGAGLPHHGGEEDGSRQTGGDRQGGFRQSLPWFSSLEPWF